mmetsp:Transcript_58548/g.96639  ORF Transcript_58548/g.96639 Transcript_58548/m.96639 type:complete len:82 (+) Transcript_58548:48-293(+)
MVFSAYHESWRSHPLFQNNLRYMFPGFGYAVAIFSTYCALEWTYTKLFPPPPKVHSHEEFDGTRYAGAFEAVEPKPTHSHH